MSWALRPKQSFYNGLATLFSQYTHTLPSQISIWIQEKNALSSGTHDFFGDWQQPRISLHKHNQTIDKDVVVYKDTTPPSKNKQASKHYDCAEYFEQKNLRPFLLPTGAPHLSRHPSAWDDLTAPLQKETNRNWPSLFLYKLLLSWRERQFAHRYTCLMLATLHIFALEKSIDTFWNFSPHYFYHVVLLRFIFLFPYYTAFPTVFMWIPNVPIIKKQVCISFPLFQEAPGVGHVMFTTFLPLLRASKVVSQTSGTVFYRNNSKQAFLRPAVFSLGYFLFDLTSKHKPWQKKSCPH